MTLLKSFLQFVVLPYSLATTWVNTRKEVRSLKEEYLAATEKIKRARDLNDEWRIDILLVELIIPINERRMKVICLPGITLKDLYFLSQVHEILRTEFRDSHQYNYILRGMNSEKGRRRKRQRAREKKEREE